MAQISCLHEMMNLVFSHQPISNSLVIKRDSPNYAQVSGYVPKELALRFKILCTSEEISQSEALEEAVAIWIEKREKLKRDVPNADSLED
ncbi:MAG: hypothetical protein WBB28_07085 [Crinalium sp.]